MSMPISKPEPIKAHLFPLVGYEPDGADCTGESWGVTPEGRFLLLTEVRRGGVYERYVDGVRVS
jgi:hypothetical protein